MNLKQLREMRAKYLADAHAIRDAAKAEGRERTDEENKQIAAKLEDVASLDAQIDALIAEREQDDAIAAADRKNAAQKAASVEVVGEARRSDPACGYTSVRDYLCDVIRAGKGQGVTERLRPLATAGSDEHGTYSDAYGGFGLPIAFAPNMLALQAESDFTAGMTTRIPSSAPGISIRARTDKTHSSSVTGGLQFYRRATSDTVSATRMATELLSLKANSLMGLSYAEEELLRDSPVSFAALIEQGFREQYGSHILNEKINGNGIGEFLGVLSSPALVSITKETNQPASTIVSENVIKMRARCWNYRNAVWVANHDTLPQLAKLALNVGTGGVALWIQSAVPDVPDMLLGRPVYFTEYAQTLGTAGDLLLVDWSQYLEMDYQPLETAESVEVRFVYNERAFRVTARNDGMPWWRSALTPKNSTSTLSPIVAIASRS